MSSKRKKKYIPRKQYNPVQQAKRIDKIAEDLEIHKRHIKAISVSHDNHITHLGNFARHDIKNTIQNIDSILSTVPANQFTEETIASLASFLEVMRSTIDNFAKLVPYSSTGKFNLNDLMVAVELLARAEMQRSEINISFDYPRQTPTEVALPFQAILQMMNNLIINAIKSLESISNKKMLIFAEINDEILFIKIKDNGVSIKPEDSDKIFDYGYSTTGGSGIGLFHARFLCTNFSGSINLDLIIPQNDTEYNKTFSIQLPLIIDQNGKNHPDN